MNRESSINVLRGNFLRGCPCFSPGGKQYVIEGFSQKEDKFLLLPFGSFTGSYLLYSWDEISLGANRVAVTEFGLPLFFMDEETSRIYCSPHVKNLASLDIGIYSLPLSSVFEISLIKGKEASND